MENVAAEPLLGVGMSPGSPRLWDTTAARQEVLPCPRRRGEHPGGGVGGAGAPQTCATLTWDQTQHPPKQEGISVLRVTSEARGQPSLSQSHGAGGSSTGAPSQVTGAHGDIPTSLFLTGLSLVPSLLQLIPHRDCVGSPGREGLPSPALRKSRISHQLMKQQEKE